MKIAQVLFSGLGGHGSVAFSLARGDSGRAHKHAMVFYGIEPLAAGYAAGCAELGITYQVVSKRPGLDLRSWREFVGALKRAAPDVVLLHSTSLVAAAAAYTRASGTPLVAVDHLSNQVKQPRDWRFTALSLALADGMVFLTEEFATEVKARLGRLYSPQHVQVIGNGIDVAAFAPAATRARPAAEVVRVGMHSRFSPSKDHSTLLRAIARLRADEPNRTSAPVHLALAGDGETLAATKQLTRDLAIEDHVEFLGMLPESALPAYLGSLDLFVQSSHGETMSTGVMQAMAAGLPVVASDVLGLRSMVREGETGGLFPLGDAAALARVLAALAGDPARRARLGREALEHARRHWSHETMFQLYEAMMSRLRAQNNRPGPSGLGNKLRRFSRFFRSREE